MANKWFETVAEAQRRSKRRLPKSVYGALIAGSERGITVEDNVGAFAELGFAPHVAGLADSRDLATKVMGQEISFPVLISPTGVQAVHPEGEVAVARAAAARGTAMGLSSFGSKPVEEVVAANPQTFFQIYWIGRRGQESRYTSSGPGAGAVGLIATLDWSASHGRDRGSPVIPRGHEPAHHHALRPTDAGHRVRSFLRPHRKPPDLTTPNMVPKGQVGPTFFGAYGQWMQTPPPSWDDVAWLREQWDGPFMLKGVTAVARPASGRSTAATAPSRCRTTAATTRILQRAQMKTVQRKLELST